MEPFLKRTWAQVDLDALDHNIREIRSVIAPSAKLMCVIKADGYGHGAVPLAKESEAAGADWFAVSNLEEAQELREAGIQKPILILGFTPDSDARLLAQMEISQAVLSESHARQLSSYAQEAGTRVRVHIAVDTGMTRIGLSARNQTQALEAVAAYTQTFNKMRFIETEIAELPGLLLEGLFTHFAVADEAEAGADYTKRQYQSFRLVADTLKGWGISIPFCHCSNSAGILDYPEMNFNLVRAGIILYGLEPSSKVRRPLDLRPLMELKSVVSMVKTVGPGVDVSYGRTYTTRRETKIATVPIGYADGYPRALSNLGEMLVRGQRARIIGRVCMDQLMLDVTHIPDVEEGDVVTVFGRDGGAFLPVEEVSSLDQTINYETVCQITKRVPRIYRGGKLGGIEKAGRLAR